MATAAAPPRQKRVFGAVTSKSAIGHSKSIEGSASVTADAPIAGKVFTQRQEIAHTATATSAPAKAEQMRSNMRYSAMLASVSAAENSRTAQIGLPASGRG